MYKFAIIGCGRISKRHAENIEKIGKLEAVCDFIPERAREMGAQYSARVYHTIDDLLKNEKGIDIISVCTPNGLHAEHTIKSLQAGKHVLCEKPLCLTSAGAWQIIETEKFSGRKLFLVKSTRYNPILQDVKKLLEEGTLGQVYSFHLSCLWNRPASYYTDWRGRTFPDGGTLYTQFSHYVDAILWLFGDVKDIKGFAANSGHKGIIDFEDTGAVSLQMKNQALGTFQWSVNAYKKNHEIALTIVAEKGTIRIGGEYLNEVQYQQMEKEFHFRESKSAANDYQFYKGSMSNHTEVYQHLLQVLEKDDHSFTGAFDGLKTVETIERIYKAVSIKTS